MASMPGKFAPMPMAISPAPMPMAMSPNMGPAQPFGYSPLQHHSVSPPAVGDRRASTSLDVSRISVGQPFTHGPTNVSTDHGETSLMVQDGSYRHLQVVSGKPVERGKAGVGIFFQQEASEPNIYVASMVPGGSALRNGRIRIGDELVGIQNYPISPQTSLEDLRKHILGPAGSFVLLSLRRPGGVNGTGARNDYWYFEVELQRLDPKENKLNDPVQRKSVQRAAHALDYSEEISILHQQLDMARDKQQRSEGPEIARLRQEVQEREQDLQSIEAMYQRAREKLNHAQLEEAEVLQQLTKIQEESSRLSKLDRDRSARFEELHRESGNQLGRMDTSLGELENEFKGEQRAHQDYQLRLHEADEELAQLQKASDERPKMKPDLCKKLYEKHAEMSKAILEQEKQMQLLSDIIPSLDMVHSSLISSMSLEPVRDFSIREPPPPPQMAVVRLEGGALPSSMRSGSPAGPMPSLGSSLYGGSTLNGNELLSRSLSRSLGRMPTETRVIGNQPLSSSLRYGSPPSTTSTSPTSGLVRKVYVNHPSLRSSENGAGARSYGDFSLGGSLRYIRGEASNLSSSLLDSTALSRSHNSTVVSNSFVGGGGSSYVGGGGASFLAPGGSSSSNISYGGGYRLGSTLRASRPIPETTKEELC